LAPNHIWLGIVTGGENPWVLGWVVDGSGSGWRSSTQAKTHTWFKGLAGTGSRFRGSTPEAAAAAQPCLGPWLTLNPATEDPWILL